MSQRRHLNNDGNLTRNPARENKEVDKTNKRQMNYAKLFACGLSTETFSITCGDQLDTYLEELTPKVKTK